jgi:hypothetical protein
MHHLLSVEEHESVDSLQAVLLDNTPVNTGYKGGLVACLEKKLDRKLHTIGCFLHMNELPLHHLICDLDGSTVTCNWEPAVWTYWQATAWR